MGESSSLSRDDSESAPDWRDFSREEVSSASAFASLSKASKLPAAKRMHLSSTLPWNLDILRTFEGVGRKTSWGKSTIASPAQVFVKSSVALAQA